MIPPSHAQPAVATARSPAADRRGGASGVAAAVAELFFVNQPASRAESTSIP
jgi:hypothetical protein